MGEVGFQELIMNGLREAEMNEDMAEVDIKEEEEDEGEDTWNDDPNFDEVMQSMDNTG